MKITKLMIILESLIIFAVAFSENGFVKLVGLMVLVFLGLGIIARLEKEYNVHNR